MSKKWLGVWIHQKAKLVERCHVCPLRIRPIQLEAGVPAFREAASFGFSPYPFRTIFKLRSKFHETGEVA